MRYPKGSISVSTGQDVPVLRQVLQSRFITHDQLFEFMRVGCYEVNRHTFNWRVRRLVNNGFLDVHFAGHSCVYSIASAGASLLAVTEEYCPVLSKRKDTSCYDHSLELNELHLLASNTNARRKSQKITYGFEVCSSRKTGSAAFYTSCRTTTSRPSSWI